MPYTLREALEKYDLYARARGFSQATIDHTRLCVTLFDDFLNGNKEAGEITTNDFRFFLADLRQRPLQHGFKKGNLRPLSGTSINTYARGIKAFFSFLKSENIITVNPLATEPAPKKPKTIPKVYSESDLNTIIQTVAHDLRNTAIVFFFLDTGVRLAGLSQLTLSAVDLHGGVAKVIEKGRQERLVPFQEWSAAAIENYIKNGRPKPEPGNTDHLFLTESGHPLSASGIQSMLERLGREAGVKERLAPHKLRHSFATYSLKYGGNLEYLRIILGHTDIKTTSNAYLNADIKDIKKAHEEFSPLSNLMGTGVDERPSLPKQRTEQQRKNPKEQPESDVFEHPPSMQTESLVTKHRTLKKHNKGIDEDEKTKKGPAPERTENRLRPILWYRNLYTDHLRKLAILAGELATDIENGNLERQRYSTKTKSIVYAGLELGKVFHAQNSRLWPYLAQHFKNEFANRELTLKIARVAADLQISRTMKKEPREKALAESVREILVLMCERGTFEGTCDICSNYF